MKNLTKNQELIIEQLVAEFTNINETFTAHGDNIFKPLLVDVSKDEKRVAEINALNKAGKEAIKDQMARDYDKFHWMFEELGLTLKSSLEDPFIWRLRTRGNLTTDTLAWGYWSITKEADFILGCRRSYIKGHFIKYGHLKFETIEQLFDHESFKENLKNFIANK